MGMIKNQFLILFILPILFDFGLQALRPRKSCKGVASAMRLYNAARG
jgi:hypothetical protein